jgi:hypothetical protein
LRSFTFARYFAGVAPTEKAPIHNDCPESSVALKALRTLYRAENIGSALKAGVNVCQR